MTKPTLEDIVEAWRRGPYFRVRRNKALAGRQWEVLRDTSEETGVVDDVALEVIERTATQREACGRADKLEDLARAERVMRLFADGETAEGKK